jgi:hypothetical protein
VTSDDLEKNYFGADGVYIMNQLDEVVIRRYSNVCSFIRALYLQKSHTAAEREVENRNGLNYCCGWKYGGGSVSLDPLFNIISGRTAMLKKD